MEGRQGEAKGKEGGQGETDDVISRSSVFTHALERDRGKHGAVLKSVTFLLFRGESIVSLGQCSVE